MFQVKELFELSDLNIKTADSNKKLIQNVSFKLNEQDIFVLLGNEDSGKSLVAKSIISLFNNKKIKLNGDLFLRNIHLNILEEKDYKELLDKNVSYISKKCNSTFSKYNNWYKSLLKLIKNENTENTENTEKRINQLLKKMKINNIEELKQVKFGQLSLGNKRKISLARSFLLKSSLLIFEEPLNGLSLLEKNDLIELILTYKKEMNAGILLTTADGRVASHLADRVGIINKGKLIEQKAVKDLFENPRHELTKKLVDPDSIAAYQIEKRNKKVELTIENLTVRDKLRPKWWSFQSKTYMRIDQLNYIFERDKIYGIVIGNKAEKMNLAQVMAKEKSKIAGELKINKKEYSKKEVQYLSSRENISLNKNKRAKDLFENPEEMSLIIGIEDLQRPIKDMNKNEKFRIEAALTVFKNPQFIIFEEPTFDIDYSEHDKVWRALINLHNYYGFGLIVISEEIDELNLISDYLLIMDHGRLVESGEAGEIINNPRHPYTRLLFASSLQRDPKVREVQKVVRKDLKGEFKREYFNHYDYEDRPYDLVEISTDHFIAIKLDSV